MKIKNIVHKHVFLLLAFLMLGNLPAQKGKPVLQFSKELTDVNKNSVVIIKSDFSDIDIETWDTTNVFIQAKLFVEGDQEVINYLKKKFHFEATRRNDAIVISSGAPEFSSYDKKNMHYYLVLHVKVPSRQNIKIISDFSKINLAETHGRFELKGDFNKLNLGYLYAKNNLLDGDYLRGNIKFAHGLKINSDFSRLHIDLVFYMNLKSDHSKFNLKHVKQLQAEGDFLHIRANRISKMNAGGDNQQIWVKRIYFLKSRGDFNEWKITELPASFHLIDMAGSYGKISIQNPFQVPYLFKIIIENTSFDFDRLTVTSKEKSDDVYIYKGYYGRNDAHGVIQIKQENGSIFLINKKNE